MIIQLPNGLIDGMDRFDFAEIEELKGKQQNYLANRDLVVGNIGHLPKILTDLVVSLQTKEGLKWQGKMEEAIYKLSSGDLETILVKIREATYGPRYYFEAECPHCQKLNKNLRIDLDKLEIECISTEEMMKSKVAVLPKSQVEIEFKPIYLRDLFEIIKISKNRQDALITSLVAVSVKRLGTSTKVTAEDIDNIPAMDIEFIQETISNTKLEGHIDTNLQLSCVECGKDFEQKLSVFDASFFYRTKA
jgi:hypothetical protein